MCNDATENLRSCPHQLFIPALVICIIMFAFNFCRRRPEGCAGPETEKVRSENMEPILKIENLKTSFMTSGGEVQAVRGVSFSVGKGRFSESWESPVAEKALPPCPYSVFWQIRPELRDGSILLRGGLDEAVKNKSGKSGREDCHDFSGSDVPH